MAGLGVSLFTDEHVHGRLARALRSRGYDAESCHEAGRADQGISDEDQLIHASGRSRAILTFNIGDFVRLDVEWKRVGRRHAGIIVSPRVDDLGELLRRVERHLNTYGPEVQQDTLIWLGSIPTL